MAMHVSSDKIYLVYYGIKLFDWLPHFLVFTEEGECVMFNGSK